MAFSTLNQAYRRNGVFVHSQCLTTTAVELLRVKPVLFLVSISQNSMWSLRAYLHERQLSSPNRAPVRCLWPGVLALATATLIGRLSRP